MQKQPLKAHCAPAVLLSATMMAQLALADGTNFSTLYTFQVANAATGASPDGSQPDTRPVLGTGNTVYGMTYTGGVNGNGVIYRYDLGSGQYTVLHTFSALDGNGFNSDGATPGVALTRGPLPRCTSDRLAVYRYAHMPRVFKDQRQINSADLPDARARLGLLQLPSRPRPSGRAALSWLMAFLRYGERLASSELGVRRARRYLPQLPRYAAATRCQPVYELVWMPARIPTTHRCRYVA